MPRNFATFGSSELQPPFTVDSKLMPLDITFLTLQHWADVSLYTSSYNLAETYVFSKQSLSSIFCDLILTF